MAAAAYWYDTKTGNFISSTYYFPDLPAWVSRPSDKYAEAEWTLTGSASKARHLPVTPGLNLYEEIVGSPFRNELLESFAEMDITAAEKLGLYSATDLLTIRPRS